jgi:beta-lactamase regulating signal transducer with metallopeptidase domain
MTTLITAGLVAKTWLVALAWMAAQGTILAIVALALTRLAGRLRPAWQAAIWLVVVVKFALPWGPGLRWSLSDLFALLTRSAPPEVASPLPPALAPLPPAPHAWHAIAWLVVAAIWAAGATLVIARAIRAHRRTVIAARTSQLAPAFAQRLVAQLAAQLKVRTPQLRIGAADVGPHVIGFVRTTIVVPPALIADDASTARDTNNLLRAALLHELAHVRRRDVLGRAAQVAAIALLWFWPIVRVVGRRLDAARETACDAWALEAGALARPTYARLLVRMAELHAAAAPSLAAPNALNARVAAVLGPMSFARTTRVQRTVLAGFALLALGGARTASAHPDRAACKYTPELAQALYLSYPEADLDGDGQLSRDEACSLQAELRRLGPQPQLVSHLDPASEAELQTWLEEPLCCNCETPEANSATCTQVGADPR